MPLRRISSLGTVLYKFVFPAIFAIGLIKIYVFDVRHFPSRGDDFPPDVFFMVMPFVFLAAVLWSAWRLKWVAIDAPNRNLYVSNYRKEIVIPFSEIASVTEFFFSAPRRVTIHLHNETEFGKKIVLLGKYRFPDGILAGSHPIVDELRKLSVADRPPRIPKLGPR